MGERRSVRELLKKDKDTDVIQLFSIFYILNKHGVSDSEMRRMSPKYIVKKLIIIYRVMEKEREAIKKYDKNIKNRQRGVEDLTDVGDEKKRYSFIESMTHAMKEIDNKYEKDGVTLAGKPLFKPLVLENK